MPFVFYYVVDGFLTNARVSNLLFHQGSRSFVVFPSPGMIVMVYEPSGQERTMVGINSRQPLELSVAKTSPARINGNQCRSFDSRLAYRLPFLLLQLIHAAAGKSPRRSYLKQGVPSVDPCPGHSLIASHLQRPDLPLHLHLPTPPAHAHSCANNPCQ